MLKKWLLVLLFMVAGMGFAMADVEVNSADQAALDGVKGIGAVMSKKILEERTAHGPFKDWADLQKRVKGIGDKSSANLSTAGLRVNGQVKAGAPAAGAAVASQAGTVDSAASKAASASAAAKDKPVSAAGKAASAK